MFIRESELILNPNGSIYHLNVRKEHLAETILLVGDPDRVPLVSNYFDKVEYTSHKREFCTHTGFYKGKRLTVLSTGIGPDNIDIVINEIDALFNVDMKTRQPKEECTQLNFIRIGTSGSLHSDIPTDSIVASAFGLGLDNMLHSYANTQKVRQEKLEEAFVAHTQWNTNKGRPYAIKCGELLETKLISDVVFSGITATAPGFYAPQGRVLRLPLQDASLSDKLQTFTYENHRVTNLEMETSAIYGLAKLLGHQAISFNAIIANRALGTFSQNPKKAIENLIEYVLNKLTYKHQTNETS